MGEHAVLNETDTGTAHPKRWVLRVAWISCGVAAVARMFPYAIYVLDTAGFAPAVMSTAIGMRFYVGSGLISFTAMVIVIIAMHMILEPLSVMARVARTIGLLSCCFFGMRFVFYMTFGLGFTMSLFNPLAVFGLSFWWIVFNYLALRASLFHSAIAWLGIVSGVFSYVSLFLSPSVPGQGTVGQFVGIASSCGFATWLVAVASILLLRDMHAGMAPVSDQPILEDTGD